MDPISAMLLAGVLAVLLTKTASAGVTDTIAQAKGQTPPSLEKWREKQKDRGDRGKAPEKDPGPWGRRWRMAVETYVAKAAQKHQARMEYLDETAPENIARRKEKLRKRAERMDKANTAVAGWGAVSWGAAKQAAAKVKEYHDEAQAWKENERRSADPDQTDPTVYEGLDEDRTWKGAYDEGFAGTGNPEYAMAYADWHRDTYGHLGAEDRPSHEDVGGDHFSNWSADKHGTPRSYPDLPMNPATTSDDSTTTEGNPVSTAQNTNTEITDLDTAISYSQETVRYTDTVGGTLADITAQLDAAAAGLNAEAATYEQAKASLAAEGFGSKVTGRFDAAAEALHAAAEALSNASQRAAAASEQTTTAGGEMRGAVKTFSDQLSLAENVGAARQDGGVSKRTDFYAPA